MVSKADRRVAAINHNFEQRESCVSRSNIRLLFFNSLHRDTVRIEHRSRGEGRRAETSCNWPAESLAHGWNELLFPTAA